MMKDYQQAKERLNKAADFPHPFGKALQPLHPPKTPYNMLIINNSHVTF
ncbi:hypothetical protein XIS1_1190046 [Xenorhabdus innexi]|uniref:Uncharacterized protein n=1 Tax=Xenorhabdus innexi TaxID=290109 RepID=A0A1N6MRV5_9GAMM|nr:hypothetical protein XIS1_1190046 [Xenorhabdus innexi]